MHSIHSPGTALLVTCLFDAPDAAKVTRVEAISPNYRPPLECRDASLPKKALYPPQVGRTSRQYTSPILNGGGGPSLLSASSGPRCSKWASLKIAPSSRIPLNV